MMDYKNEADATTGADVLELTLRPTFESLSGGQDETENDDAVLYEQGLSSEPLDVEVDEDFIIENGMEAVICSPEGTWACNEDSSNPDHVEKLSAGCYRYMGEGKIHRL